MSLKIYPNTLFFDANRKNQADASFIDLFSGWDNIPGGWYQFISGRFWLMHIWIINQKHS
ncbi:MAG: hypothetical protein ACRYFL_11965 [Janthinobacterium lividum]